ncbi:HAD hydrolase-like protein [Aliiroseovarius sp.]|uniref:HAD hydrolase-like protein n=1 Tax=Aliiroseovarius sp. TaxID=1872442 RepID=UPI003BA9AC6D
MTVFLDLDGTLTDPKPGITGSIVHAMTSLGLDCPPAETLTWAIGPALIDTFAKLGAPDPEAALDAYRAVYATGGLFNNRVYDGIPEALAALRDAGQTLHLATAKPHVYARRITAHFDLARFLTHEFGPEMDGTRNDKGELLAYALELTGDDPASCVMVGDRHHDFTAAAKVGMRSIAVTWGYGTPEEHVQATVKCETPGDLPGVVRDLIG